MLKVLDTIRKRSDIRNAISAMEELTHGLSMLLWPKETLPEVFGGGNKWNHASTDFYNSMADLRSIAPLPYEVSDAYGVLRRMAFKHEVDEEKAINAYRTIEAYLLYDIPKVIEP